MQQKSLKAATQKILSELDGADLLSMSELEMPKQKEVRAIQID